MSDPIGARDDCWSVVVPTVGRPTLTTLLESLDAQARRPVGIFVVDDRPAAAASTPLAVPDGVHVVRSGGRGPAAARNVGWRKVASDWVVFLDDDVVLPPDWSTRLEADLDVSGAIGGVSAGIAVPRASATTDWGRNTVKLESARWATADMAYRVAALRAVGGFDERFRRAYREDADLARRVRDAGWELVAGRRVVVHPARDESPWASVRAQRGNADDALMRARHGRRWRRRTDCTRGRLALHAVAVAACTAAIGGALGRRRSLASIGTLVWAGLAGELTARRLPGARSARRRVEVVLSSLAIPFAAVGWRVAGTWKHRRVPAAAGGPGVSAVLLDRDGVLVENVPYNGSADAVAPVDGVRAALDRLRAAGVRLAVVTNQSAIGRGFIDAADEQRVRARIETVLGPFDAWHVCPHAPQDACRCRKPAPGLVHDALASLNTPRRRAVLVGDRRRDVDAAAAAGVRAVLVPSADSTDDDLRAAPIVRATLGEAVSLLLEGEVAADG